MSKIIAEIRKSGKASLVLLMSICAISAVAIFFAFAQEGDEDDDGIGSSYEIFFSVNYANPAGLALSSTNSADAAMDFDNDGADNLSEYLHNTDPFNADTDNDGFSDAVDTNPVSRAHFKWGDLFWLTTNSEYSVVYAQPEWVLAAFQTGGEWKTNSPVGWYVPAETAENTGVLSIMVDRSMLTNDAVLKVKLYDSTNSTLYLDLVDAEAVVVATNIAGNIISATESIVTTNIVIPFESYPTAVAVELRRGTGAITVYESQLYVDKDGDGFDSDQETQMGTSDNDANSRPYYLTVNSGLGGGWYAPGVTVSIVANTAPTGQVFNIWTGDASTVADAYAATTTITMPAANAALTPVYIVIEPAGGTILREVWTNISGTALSSLTTNSLYPANPSIRISSTSFESPVNWSDNYGTKMRGYVHPQQTGNYTFWIAADDTAQLWLSTDGNPFNKVLIASVPSWTSSREWTKYTNQQSLAIHLEAGRKYYIEAIQKEGAGGDNFAVAWQGPGISQSVIGGAYLSADATNYAPVAGITISTNVEDILTEVGFSASASTDPESGSMTYSWNFGDGSYGTGITTTHAYTNIGTYTVRVTVADDQGASSVATGTVQIVNVRDPENPANVVAGMEYKYFEGTWTNLPDFNLLTPVRMGSTTNFNIDPRLRNTTFGFKYSGYIQVPSDGQYTFYTSSDDGSKLYIGSQLIVSNDFQHGMTEKSGSIWLRAGKHAISVEMFQNSSLYGLEARYAGPGISKQIIPAEVLYRLNNPVTLTVNGGTGGGSYEAGWTVFISAGSSPSGAVFTSWTGDTNALSSIYVLNPLVTMPASNATVTAVFTDMSSIDTGTILREVWTNITGYVLTNLTSNSLYPASPSFRTSCTNFDAPINWADNYGTKMSGYLYPPVAGNYTFYIAADDTAQLWLSSDQNPSNKVLIAWVNGWTPPRSWTNYTSQTSSNITLEAGRRYYIEALQKEGGGSDNLSVAWTGPVGTETNVITGGFISPIPTNKAPTIILAISTNLEDIATPISFDASGSHDPEGSTISISWDFGDGDTASGLTASHSYANAGIYTAKVTAADTEGAAAVVASIIQIVNMRDPENPANTVNGLEYKYYEGTWTNMPDFSLITPVRMGGTTNINLNPRLRNTSIGLTFSGYIDVPTDGQYTFYTTSDDGSKIYIGNQLVVANDFLHGMVEKSGNIWLRAGKHAIKVEMFQNGSLYGLEARYAGPGIDKQLIPDGVLYWSPINPVTLTVTGGTGSGTYEQGWTVGIAADSSPSGMVFTGWTGGDGYISNIYAPMALVTLPATDITVTAEFTDITNLNIGTIFREVWTNITGNAVSSLTGSYLYPDAPSFWNSCTNFEAPVNWGSYYGTRMRGYLYPSVTGEYKFFIASDDYGQLWLSPDGNPSNKVLIAWVNGWTPYHSWTNYTSQMSTSIVLEAGRRYYIEALQKEGAGSDNLSVAWTGPVGTETNVIDGIYLSPIVIDSDTNGLRDTWEMQYFGALGQDPNADPDGDGLTNLIESRFNCSPFLSDTDSDGISDANEISVSLTNPAKADSDGDGMPDKWEVDNNLNAMVKDATADPDGDGLVNIDEYKAGTNPHNQDTDGDGVNDYIEIKQAFSDALVADFNGVITDLQSVNGGDITGSLGTWTKEGSIIYAQDRNGYVEYSITVPNDGIFALKVEATQRNSFTLQNEFDLSLYIDGVFSGRYILHAPYGTVKSATFFMPWLSSGTHTARIRWRNLEANTFLQVNSVKLQSFGGIDANSNSIPDWQENRMVKISGMSTPPSVSLISPVCMEGESYYQDTLSVSADYVPEGYTQQVITANHGIGNNWYANVLLSPTNNTMIYVIDQNGASSFSNVVDWQALNILDGVYTNDFLLRLNDSLKLIAYPLDATNGTVTVEILNGTNVVTNVVTTTDQPFVYKFEQSGTFTVNGTFSNESFTTNLAMTVKVVNASFAADPVCIIGDLRTWDCPNIPNAASIEYDSSLAVSANTLPGGGATFSLAASETTAYIVARLGGNGPVLDNAKIAGVVYNTSAYGTVNVVETFADGSKLIEIVISISDIPSDLSVALHVFVGGVTFDDGTIDRIVTANDFNELGQYRYRLIKGPDVKSSVCHTTLIYQGTTFIGVP